MAAPDPKLLPGATLAYMGDAVLEVLVRRRLVENGQTQSGKMNKLALSFVKATEQSKAVDRILPHLVESNDLHCDMSASSRIFSKEFNDQKKYGNTIIKAYLNVLGK